MDIFKFIIYVYTLYILILYQYKIDPNRSLRSLEKKNICRFEARGKFYNMLSV